MIIFSPNIGIRLQRKVSVTRTFFESIEIFYWKCEENCEKGPKLCLKSENLCYKIQFTKFLFLNIVVQIFKISTIMETLVTVRKVWSCLRPPRRSLRWKGAHRLLWYNRRNLDVYIKSFFMKNLSLLLFQSWSHNKTSKHLFSMV